MSGSCFFDTNVLIYIYSNDDPIKRNQATVAVAQSRPWVSTQVLTEFGNVARRKLNQPWPEVLSGSTLR